MLQSMGLHRVGHDLVNDDLVNEQQILHPTKTSLVIISHAPLHLSKIHVNENFLPDDSKTIILPNISKPQKHQAQMSQCI